MTDPATPPAPKTSRARRIAPFLVVGAVFGMLALTYASVPLYRMFCSATGYEGTPRIVEGASATRGKRILRVRFDANVGHGLPWDFAPELPQIDLRTGQTATVYFKVTNRSDHPITAHAVYNVGPGSIGGYFNKISCFCFTDQTLAAHETAEMPVVFYLDPALEQDESMDGVEEVWLSYTFYPAGSSADASADAKRKL